MNNPILLSNSWYFKPQFCQEDLSHFDADADCGGWQKVNLPHTVKELPFNCFSHDETAMISSYRKDFTIPAEAAGKRIILRFDGVMAYYDLYCNGIRIGDHRGGYSISFMDITEAVRYGAVNHLFLKVDSTERNDIPPFGYIVDFLTYGGIYRDVYLYMTEQTYISNVMARYRLEDDWSLTLYPEVFFHSHETAGREASICCRLIRQDGTTVFSHTESCSVAEGESSFQMSPVSAGMVDLWDIDAPVLYTVETELLIDGHIVDSHSTKTGFRKTECTSHGFYLNGQKIKLRGVNRHQCYPYVGYAMGRGVQRKDAELIRYDMACNTVRTSHYMQSQYFLER